MGVYAMKLPDVGEGVAEAELTEWRVKIGDIVREDDILADVMTDKATVEIPSSVSGTVVWIAGEVGDTLAIGSDLVRIEVEGDGNMSAEAAAAAPAAAPSADAAPSAAAAPKPEAAPKSEAAPKPAPAPVAARLDAPAPFAPRAPGEKPLAPPSVRRRALDLGIDLRLVHGEGPAGRITHEDLDRFVQQGGRPSGEARRRFADPSIAERKVVGLRRKIAERMSLSKARIPHITIVEEVDVQDLETLRARLNGAYAQSRGKLTILPFLMLAIAQAAREQPGMNAHYDDEADIVREFGGVHIGVATQTPGGLVVPVARHVEAMGVWDAAAEVARLADAARAGSASRDELMGSTITITSLGPLGAIATTPIINHPEVAIVGVNKLSMRPVWDGERFQPRRVMNLSSSFDHRVIDGWDAAVFVQRLKALLETPALIFVES